MVERACALADGPVIEVHDWLEATTPPSRGEMPLMRLEEAERLLIRQALESTGGRIAGTRGPTAILGLHPNTLRSRMERLGLN